LIHEALSKKVTLSKRHGRTLGLPSSRSVLTSDRDIYYRDPALFGSQTAVDRYVDDIAFAFGVPRSTLNVTAVAKGLVAGAVTFCRRDGSSTNALSDREGMLVPNLKEVLSVSMSAVKWVIVIEKEASFRSITASKFWERISNEGIIITAKGYPDIATRALLRFLTTASPRNSFASPAVHGLVDFDPDGLAILSVYKDGSHALAHENAELRVPQIKWLGLRSEHMLFNTYASQGLLALTARDRRKAQKMLERSEDDLKRELQVMLMLNMKAELQILDAAPDGMTDLLNEGLYGK
jgi:meiotic recombination protein SPO11